MLDKQLQAALDRRRQKGTLRRLTKYETAAESSSKSHFRLSHAQSDEKPLVDFSSNDYMGLAHSDELRERFALRLQESHCSPVGSTGSRLLDGNSVEHEEVSEPCILGSRDEMALMRQQLEHRLASTFNSPSSLLFNSGYDANSSMLSVLPQGADYIVHDSLIHASAHDGMRASRTKAHRRLAFRHNDLSHLARILDEITSDPSSHDANVFILVEAVYSMDGDLCHLKELVNVVDSRLRRERRCLIVDEAHSVGLYGLNGAGLADEMGVCGDFDIRLATFGKAFGCSGAAVLCKPLVRTFLINYARPLIYSTALPHTTLLAIHSALDVLMTPQGALRAMKTFSLTRSLLEGITDLLRHNRGSPLSLAIDLDAPEFSTSSPSHAPIVPLIVPNPRALATHLIQAGFLVRPIVYPTVPQGSERVRICIHSHNSPEDVAALVRSVGDWLSKTTTQSQVKSKL